MTKLQYNNENLLSLRLKKRIEGLPQDIREKLELAGGDCQLRVIKRKRSYPQKGDVFLINPKEDIYFIGIVINNHICNINGDDLLVVMIFKDRRKSMDVSGFVPDFNNLLIDPVMVGKEYWTRGYFFTVDHIEFEAPEYGFYDICREKFMNEYGNEVKQEPRLLGLYSVSTIAGIGIKINRELIIDENLLEI